MTESELETKIHKILHRLNYQIDFSIQSLGNDYVVEKEDLFFTIRTIHKETEEIVCLDEIMKFNYDLENHYKNRGYLFTNRFFEFNQDNGLIILNGKIRLFDINEINRLDNY